MRIRILTSERVRASLRKSLMGHGALGRTLPLYARTQKHKYTHTHTRTHTTYTHTHVHVISSEACSRSDFSSFADVGRTGHYIVI